MNIAISGSTGFIGSKISEHLAAQGHRIIPLKREDFEAKNLLSLQHAINDADVVINLAGEKLICRWSRRNCDNILSSRILTTRAIVRAINRAERPALLISASAIGYYPPVGRYDEDSDECGSGFLYNITRLWEREALKLRKGCRLVIARLGVVLDTKEGAFQMMRLGYKFKILFSIGDRDREISWIDSRDLVRAVELAIENKGLHGVVNMVAPRPATYRDIIASMKQCYSTKLTITIPELVMRLVYGQAAEIIYKSQAVLPKRLREAKFKYNSPNFHEFINQDHSHPEE